MSKKFETGKKRVIAFIGHGGSGKTSVADAMIYLAGGNERVGKVDDKTSMLDVEPEEQDTKHTIVPGFFDAEWNKHQLYMIDTPGISDVIHETQNSLQAVGGAVLMLSASDGVRVQTLQVAGFAKEQEVPLVACINALDKEHTSFDKVIAQMEEELDINPLPLVIPIGEEAGFNGVVNVLTQKAYLYETDGSGKIKATTDVPDDMADAVESLRETVIERLIEADDEIMEKYLETMEVSDEEVALCLRKGTINRTFTPVFSTSANLNIGIRQLLDGIVECMPSPLEERPRITVDPASGEEGSLELANGDEELLKAVVFKTMTDPFAGRITIYRVFHGRLGAEDTVHVFNEGKETKEKFGKLFKLRGKKQVSVDEALPGDIVAVAKLKETVTGDTLTAGPALMFKKIQLISPPLSFAISSKKQGEEDKVGTAINRMLEEDVGLIVKREPQTKELLLYCMGQQHLDITMMRMKRMYNVEAEVRLPRIPYRETIKKEARGIQGKHKKQSGGRGQFGDTWINMIPQPRGEGFEFVNQIVGGAIPGNFIPAVEKGIVEAMVRGPLTGNPVQDIKIELYDGKYHPVDSSEQAFKLAGSKGFKAAFEKAEPILLEPVMRLDIAVPDEFMGDVMGDLNGRRGKVLGMDAEGKTQHIRAECPMIEVQQYASTLKSITGDRGTYTITFDHYEEVPAMIAQKIMEEWKKENEDAE